MSEQTERTVLKDLSVIANEVPADYCIALNKVMSVAPIVVNSYSSYRLQEFLLWIMSEHYYRAGYSIEGYTQSRRFELDKRFKKIVEIMKNNLVDPFSRISDHMNMFPVATEINSELDISIISSLLVIRQRA